MGNVVTAVKCPRELKIAATVASKADFNPYCVNSVSDVTPARRESQQMAQSGAAIAGVCVTDLGSGEQLLC